jgi:hypothetical protein
VNEQDQKRQAGSGLEERDTLEALSRYHRRIPPRHSFAIGIAGGAGRLRKNDSCTTYRFTLTRRSASSARGCPKGYYYGLSRRPLRERAVTMPAGSRRRVNKYLIAIFRLGKRSPLALYPLV